MSKLPIRALEPIIPYNVTWKMNPRIFGLYVLLDRDQKGRQYPPKASLININNKSNQREASSLLKTQRQNQIKQIYQSINQGSLTRLAQKLEELSKLVKEMIATEKDPHLVATSFYYDLVVSYSLNKDISTPMEQLARLSSYLPEELASGYHFFLVMEALKSPKRYPNAQKRCWDVIKESSLGALDILFYQFLLAQSFYNWNDKISVEKWSQYLFGQCFESSAELPDIVHKDVLSAAVATICGSKMTDHLAMEKSDLEKIKPNLQYRFKEQKLLSQKSLNYYELLNLYYSAGQDTLGRQSDAINNRYKQMLIDASLKAPLAFANHMKKMILDSTSPQNKKAMIDHPYALAYKEFIYKIANLAQKKPHFDPMATTLLEGYIDFTREKIDTRDLRLTLAGLYHKNNKHQIAANILFDSLKKKPSIEVLKQAFSYQAKAVQWQHPPGSGALQKRPISPTYRSNLIKAAKILAKVDKSRVWKKQLALLKETQKNSLSKETPYSDCQRLG